MNTKEISLKEWIEKDKKGEFNKPSIDCMVDAGWGDWHCRDSSLLNRFKRLKSMVKAVAKSPLICPKKVFVIFHNDLENGVMYDSFAIRKLDTNELVYWVCPDYPGYGGSVILAPPKYRISDNLLKKGSNKKDVKEFFKK